MKKSLLTLAVICLTAAHTPQAVASGTGERMLAQLQGILNEAGQGHVSTSVPQQGTVEVAFSPNRGALQLVLKATNSATKSIDMLAYSFTSADVTRALLAAAKRGVTIRLAVDHDQNFKSKSPKSLAALSALVNAGAAVRSVSAYSIMHDKLTLVDQRHVQTGSFNYSQAAATRNSENVLVLWSAPAVAAAYAPHFEEVWNAGQPYNGR